MLINSWRLRSKQDEICFWSKPNGLGCHVSIPPHALVTWTANPQFALGLIVVAFAKLPKLFVVSQLRQAKKTSQITPNQDTIFGIDLKTAQF